MENIKSNYGEEFGRVSRDVWNILLDKAENEAYDNINMIPTGHGLVAYGVLYRCFTDASSLAEQARMLMHPTPPKREEELAEHVEMAGQDEET